MLSSGSVSDITLVLQAQRDCSEAYGTLVQRYYERVLRLCVSKVSDPLTAEDLAQEVFVAAYTGLDKLREPDKFHPWLLGIASNVTKRYFRESGQAAMAVSWDSLRDVVGEYSCSPLSQSSPEDTVLARPEYGPYLKLVDALPHKSRESLRLRYIDGVSYEDMAAILGIPVNTAHQRVHYGKAQLRRNLMSPSAPREVREQIARIATSYHADHGKLREALAGDALANQIVLSLLDPVRTTSTSVRVFSYGEDLAENLMILVRPHRGPTMAVVRSRDPDAVRVFVHLLPSKQRVRLCLTAPQMWDVIGPYCRVVLMKQHPTYCLLPGWLNTDLSLDHAVLLDLPCSLDDSSLLRRDRGLAAILRTDENQDTEYRSSYQFFASPARSLESPGAYVLFARSGTGNLYELAYHSKFDQSSRALLRDCIASACRDLLCRGFYVTENILSVDDAGYLDLLRQVGFRHVASSVVGCIRRS